jgi:nucleotide-binding universal stress UspA family protein
MYKHILVPTDGSKLSAKAVKTALHLAQTMGARVTALHVIPPYMPPVYSEPMVYMPVTMDPKKYKTATEKHAREVLGEIERTAATLGVVCATGFVTNARPWDAILKAVRSKKCDLVVMASHGRSGLTGLLLGSETTKVLTHSKIPVLVCR